MAVSMSCFRLAILAVVAVALTASSEARAADSPMSGALSLEQMFGVPTVESQKGFIVRAYREPAGEVMVSGGGGDEDAEDESTPVTEATQLEAGAAGEVWVSGGGGDEDAEDESTPVTEATQLEAGADGVVESAGEITPEVTTSEAGGGGREEFPGESTPKGAAGLEEGDTHAAEERMDVDTMVENRDGGKGSRGLGKKQTNLTDRCKDCKPGKLSNLLKKLPNIRRRRRHGAETDGVDGVDGVGEDGSGGDVSEGGAEPSEPKQTNLTDEDNGAGAVVGQSKR